MLCKYGGLGCCAVNWIEEQIQLEAFSLPLSLSQKDFVGYLFLSQINSLDLFAIQLHKRLCQTSEEAVLRWEGREGKRGRTIKASVSGGHRNTWLSLPL